MNKNILTIIEEKINALDTNIKCLLGSLEIIHLGMLSMYDANDDTVNFELAFLHTLKNSLYSISENDIKDLLGTIEKYKQCIELKNFME